MGRKTYVVGLLTLVALLAFSFPLAFAPALADDISSEAGWDGAWNTSWTIMEYGQFKTYEFEMTLVQTGGTVVGTSDYHNWSLNGTVSGNTLDGTWAADLPSGTPHTFGQVQLTLDPSGMAFDGIFKGEYHQIWDQRFLVHGVKNDSLPPAAPAPETSPTPSPTAPAPTPTSFNWPLVGGIAGGFAVIIALMVYLFSHRKG